MSEDRVIGQFDVTLSEDLVKDVQTSGRAVKTEIWEQGEGKRGLVGCIFVDKNEQDVVRLRVTVFNQPTEGSSSDDKDKNKEKDAASSSENVQSQTESSGAIQSQGVQSQTESSGAIQSQGDTTESGTQAVQAMDEKPIQTDQQIMDEQCSQTDKVVSDQKQIQTDAAKSTQQTTQTKVKSFADFGAQTTPKFLTEQHMQTDIKAFSVGASQTIIKKFANFSFQTDPKPVAEFCMQTDQWIGTHESIQASPHTTEFALQTDPKPVNTTSVQTVIETDEKFMQTENPMAEKSIQAQALTQEATFQTDPLPVSHTQMQTDNPPLVEADVQTCRDYLVDLDTQTDDVIVLDPEEQCENDSQTDFVRTIDPRNEVESGCQTEPCKIIYPQTYADNEALTEPVKIINYEEMYEAELQTEEVWIRDPDCQAEVEIQTEAVEFKPEIETVEAEAQTHLVWVMGLSQAEEPESEGVVKEATPRDLNPEPVASVIDGADAAAPGEVPQEPGGMAPDLTPSDAFPEPGEVIEGKESMQSNIIQGGPVTGPEAEAPAGTEISADQDTQKGIQTDPVTIIIGDSSFLVNKLKVYAQREMKFMEGGNKRGAGTGRGRGRGRGRGKPSIYERGPLREPPQLSTPENVPAHDEERIMPVLDAEGTPTRVVIPKPTPMSAPAATRRPFTGLKYRTAPQDIKDICKTPEAKGRFNCPFCTLVFQDSANLYKHLRDEHGSPRASNRRRRRKGTILIAEDGSLITDDGTIEIPPLKKDLPMGPIRANNIKKSRSAILHEQHMLKMKHLDEERKRKLEQGMSQEEIDQEIAQEEERRLMPQIDDDMVDKGAGVVSNGAESQPETIQISETPLMGQRAFSCPFCPKLFTKSSALYIHLQNAHKAVKQKVTKRVRPAGEGDDYGDDDLLHEEEVELVVPAEEANAHSMPSLEQEEGEIPLHEVHGKREEGEFTIEQAEEAVEEEVHIQVEQHVEEGEVVTQHAVLDAGEMVTEEQVVVEEQIVMEGHEEEGEIVLEIQVPLQPEIEEEAVIEEGEVPVGEAEEEKPQEQEEDEDLTSPRGRGRVRTRGGATRKPANQAAEKQPERAAKRRRSEPDEDDEEMPKLTRMTRRSVQETSPVRSSTRRGHKLLSPAKRGRRT